MFSARSLIILSAHRRLTEHHSAIYSDSVFRRPNKLRIEKDSCRSQTDAARPDVVRQERPIVRVTLRMWCGGLGILMDVVVDLTGRRSETIR